MTELVCNPCGVIEPQHLGQFFYDATAEVFYQARGRTKDDWHFVAPKDFVGSFIKIYDFFVGIPADDPRGPEAARYIQDTELAKQTIALDGVEILSANKWYTAQEGKLVAMTRLRFHKIAGISLFFGFARDVKAISMPNGVGFMVEDGAVEFAGYTHKLKAADQVLLRLEAKDKMFDAFVNDEKYAEGQSWNECSQAVIALFVRSPGSRIIAPGYERALKRNLGQ